MAGGLGMRSPTDPTHRPRLFTVRELTEHFRVSQDTFYRWIQEGKFPGSFKVGRGMVRSSRTVVKSVVKEPQMAST